jgi:hypothetical protein
MGGDKKRKLLSVCARDVRYFKMGIEFIKKGRKRVSIRADAPASVREKKNIVAYIIR